VTIRRTLGKKRNASRRSRSSPATALARRIEILDAAIRVVAEGGLRGLTHRAVDAEAGLPEGSTSAYFRTRIALITAVVGRLDERIGADVEAIATEVAAHPGDPEQAMESALRLMSAWLADPAPFIARNELTMEALRRPELRDTMLTWRTGFEKLVERILVDAGIARPDERAGILVACFDGIMLHSLLPLDPSDPEAVRTMAVEQARTLLTALVGAWAPDAG
jgi:DNA-binding transcriptional regulator YbjK